MAILLGDLALAYSDRLLAGAPAPARRVFDEVRVEVNIGQYLDVLGAAQGLGAAENEAAVSRARRICEYKTAKYTVERPLHLGAALAGGSVWPSWPARCRRSAFRSARRSSSVTTCSGCSAIPP